MKNIKYIGMAIGIIAMSLAWMWFGWRMPLVIFLAKAPTKYSSRSGGFNILLDIFFPF